MMTVIVVLGAIFGGSAWIIGGAFIAGYLNDIHKFKFPSLWGITWPLWMPVLLCVKAPIWVPWVRDKGIPQVFATIRSDFNKLLK